MMVSRDPLCRVPRVPIHGSGSTDTVTAAAAAALEVVCMPSKSVAVSVRRRRSGMAMDCVGARACAIITFLPLPPLAWVLVMLLPGGNLKEAGEYIASEARPEGVPVPVPVPAVGEKRGEVLYAPECGLATIMMLLFPVPLMTVTSELPCVVMPERVAGDE